MRSVWLGGLVALSIASTAFAQQNLIKNGDFESYNNITVPDGGAATVWDGSTQIDDWDIGANSVDLVQDAYGAITHTSIDLLGTPGPGEISQAFMFDPNTTYTLSFDLTHNPDATNGAEMAVNFFGNSYLFDGMQPLQTHDVTFTTGATGGSSTLTFSSVGGDGWAGAVIDNVSVTSAVPEPATWLMMLLGFCAIGFFIRKNRETDGLQLT